MIKLLLGPHSDRVGDVLTRELRSRRWTRLTAVVAFARLSGVGHVEPLLWRFLERGGRADLTIGADMRGSTYEAAWYLMNAVANRGRLLLASAEPNATFHPKIFIFSDADPNDPSPVAALGAASEALVVAGSSNLTGGGLYLNSEASLAWTPRLSDIDVGSAWLSLANGLAPWLQEGSHLIVGRATRKRLTEMARSGRLPTELVLASARQPLLRGVAGHGRSSRSTAAPRRRPPRRPPPVGPPPPAIGPATRRAASLPGLRVLIARLSFGGSRRWPQWEFNADVLREFFGASASGSLIDREAVTRSGRRVAQPSTPLVIGKGRNRRLEFPEPDGRPDPHPAPVLIVVVDRRPAPFRYAVLMPGDGEYGAVEALNLSATPVGRYVEETRRVILPHAALQAVWPGCPL